MSTPSHRASNSAGKSSRTKNLTLDLNTAKQMLPLVRSIVAEIVNTHRRLSQLAPEQELLDDSRRALNWAGRQRRYALADEIGSAEKTLTGAVAELSALGVTLIDGNAGQVDFPTRINGRPAAFTWQFGEDAVSHWRYTGEDGRRPIPNGWQSGTPLRYRSEP